MFQHTAARRRLVPMVFFAVLLLMFQHTAARRRLGTVAKGFGAVMVGFNTQPPEGGWYRANTAPFKAALVSTHSRPKAAGCRNRQLLLFWLKFQHTAARRRLGRDVGKLPSAARFQHTAARRRLAAKTYKNSHKV